MRTGSWWLAGMASLALAGSLAGCGDDDGGGNADTAAEPALTRPADFPKAGGKSLAELRREWGPGGPVMAPSVSVLTRGRNRIGFGLFDRARKQIVDAPAAIYVAPARGGAASGPFPAAYESLAVKPQFQSKNVATDPDSAKSVYVAHVPFRRPGRYEVLAAVRLDDRLVAASRVQVDVVARDYIPGVGRTAPRIHTPTRASVGGAMDKIETRDPPDTMHEVDFADVVGKRPMMLLFATPALCQSRVCGPVVDIAEQVKASHDDEAAFIHMEIFNDNEIKPSCSRRSRNRAEALRLLASCYRSQVLAYNLLTEPWLFAIDRRGKVVARLEGAYSAREFERALKLATAG